MTSLTSTEKERWRVRSDYERDDVASDAMARGFAWLEEQQKLNPKQFPPPPKPPTPAPTT